MYWAKPSQTAPNGFDLSIPETCQTSHSLHAWHFDWRSKEAEFWTYEGTTITLVWRTQSHDGPCHWHSNLPPSQSLIRWDVGSAIKSEDLQPGDPRSKDCRIVFIYFVEPQLGLPMKVQELAYVAAHLNLHLNLHSNFSHSLQLACQITFVAMHRYMWKPRIRVFSASTCTRVHEHFLEGIRCANVFRIGWCHITTITFSLHIEHSCGIRLCNMSGFIICIYIYIWIAVCVYSGPCVMRYARSHSQWPTR